ncbi:uncharacterized protein LOC122074320 [Macadamia integrifolia]|uniref:uncharacterized protein LOC122074320 n=1 Tax=Macadamia integrifolia TaxID=60698 RepID=UPI001C4F5D64|nr:uncharacterized protein LOC122074320 [Macadamia integrifolia]
MASIRPTWKIDEVFSLRIRLRIIEAKSLEFITSGKLFVTCYLCTGNKERIRLNGREIPSTSRPYWNESVSLECSAANKDQCLDQLKQQSVVFELRWRNNSPILGRIVGSKLLGRAEIPWKDVLESSNMAIQKWVTTISASSDVLDLGLKPPALHVEMKVGVPSIAKMVKRMSDDASKKWDKCGCKHGSCSNSGEDAVEIMRFLY